MSAPRKIVDKHGIELTPAEVALLDDPADPTGRVSDARAARLHAQQVIRTAELRWTPDLVKLQMAQAAKGIERYVSRPGPSRKSGFWPEMIVEFSDMVGRSPHLTVGGDAREISLFERAIGWVPRYLGADDLEPARMAVSLWMECKAFGYSFGEHGAAEFGSRSTAYRRRDDGVNIIFDGLIAEGVLP